MNIISDQKNMHNITDIIHLIDTYQKVYADITI